MRPEATAAIPEPATQSQLEHAAWTVEALHSVWERQRVRFGERIDVIALALLALGEDRLQAPLREEAEQAVHMLAGAVGMFGFLDACNAARALESKLPQATSDRTTDLLALLGKLREGIQVPVTLCTD